MGFDKMRLFTIPNVLTLCNLLCGAAAVTFALDGGKIEIAFWLVAAGAAFDFFDGFAARMLKSIHPVGKQLDSLSDVVTFGLAPAAMLWRVCRDVNWVWVPETWTALQQWLPYAVYLMTAFAALRLARFNIDEGQKTEFTGLPAPAGGLLCASVAMLWARGLNPQLSAEVVLGLAWVTAWLFISPMRMFSLKFAGFGWEENRLRYQFILCAAVLVWFLRWTALPAIIGLYIIVSTLRWAAARGDKE